MMQSKIKAIFLHAFPLFVALHLAYFIMEYFFGAETFVYTPSRSILYFLLSLGFGFWVVNRKEKLGQS